MNTYTITLASSSSNTTQHLSTTDLVDHTKLFLNISRLNKSFIPLYLKINWGEGDSEIFDNNVIFEKRVKDNPNDPLLNGTYFHEYFPSETALFKLLSAQVFIQYANEGIYYAVIPLRIRTKSFFEAIGDLDLINTNLLPTENNFSEHQFKTTAEGYIIELRGN